MIRIHTGVPGSCKTLMMIDKIANEAEYAGRPIFAHAIEGWVGAKTIYCRNSACRRCGREVHPGDSLYIEDWYIWAPQTALICVDEAHYAFPSRREKETPTYITRLTEHRHDGVDFWLCSININMLDINARRIVQEHLHFGIGPAGRYFIRHSMAMENDAALKMGDREYFMMPKRSFNLYKSADAHVKLKREWPWKLKVAIACVPLIIGIIVYQVYQAQELRRAASPDPLPVVTDLSRPPSVNQLTLQSARGEAAQRPLAVSDRAAESPGVLPPFVPVACIYSERRACVCYDATAHRVPLDDFACRASASGSVNPERMGPEDLQDPELAYVKYRESLPRR